MQKKYLFRGVRLDVAGIRAPQSLIELLTECNRVESNLTEGLTVTDKNSSIIKTANGAALPIGIILVLGFVWATLAAARGGDPTMMPHAYMLMLVFALGIFALVYGVTQNKFVYDPYEYDDGVVKAGVYATIFWGIAGMLVGVIIASQLAFPALLSWEGFSLNLTLDGCVLCTRPASFSALAAML